MTSKLLSCSASVRTREETGLGRHNAIIIIIILIIVVVIITVITTRSYILCKLLHVDHHTVWYLKPSSITARASDRPSFFRGSAISRESKRLSLKKPVWWTDFLSPTEIAKACKALHLLNFLRRRALLLTIS